MSLIGSGFALNLAWEVAQTPLYSDANRDLSYLAWTRLHCTLGDVLILLAAFWATALLFRGREWITTGGLGPASAFVSIGILYTFWSEWWNAGVRGTWTYSENMPTLLGVGLSPLLQWLVVPSLVIVLVRHHLAPRR